MWNIYGGQREFIPTLTRAAAGAGIHALFMEVHDDPDNAMSDANTQLNIKYLDCLEKSICLLWSNICFLVVFNTNRPRPGIFWNNNNWRVCWA